MYVKPLVKSDDNIDHRIEAKVKLLVHNPKINVAEVFAILTNNVEGTIIFMIKLY